jgi:hypothetical protein
MQGPREGSRTAVRRRRAAAPEAEIYFVSYPKSGRTWLRALLGKYLVLRYSLPEKDMLQTEQITAAAGLQVSVFTHAGSEMHRKAPAVDAGFEDVGRWKGCKVAFIARDIRDTLVSAYFQATKRIGVFEGPISEFIRSERYGAKRIVSFYAGWRRNREAVKDFLPLRYEQLHVDPAAALQRALAFIGERNVDSGHVEASVAYCSFDNLRRAESEDRFGTRILRPRSIADPESYKLREGKVGSYLRHLASADIAYIDGVVDAGGLQGEDLGLAPAGTGEAVD